MTAAADKEQFTFQAEIKQLLHLLSHSLYQSREIALRELISNASDALDKMRHISLTHPEHQSSDELAIRVSIDSEKKELVIRDNGIGMTKEELAKNLGTIAHSGSLAFLNNLAGEARKDVSLIGQFGVGFYSAFMLADKVSVVSQSYSESSAWEWESEGTGTFSISPVESGAAGERGRGTSIILRLKEEAQEFSQEYRVKSVLRRYSSFIPYPIYVGEERVNDTRPIWVEPRSKLTDEQYDGFYAHLTHRTGEKPLWRLHLSVDSPIQFHAILYCPHSNFERLGFGKLEHGLSLCAKRVLVQSDCKEILPDYLRFLHGLVDSEDLPLNVSRESLQDNTVFRKIKSVLVKKTLERLDSLAADEPEQYLTFYKQFGSILKEGIHSDYEHRERIAKLLRLHSSAMDSPEKLTSLDDYLKRAPESQKYIYYLGGPDLAAMAKSPNLEIFARHGVEVLFLPDPVDEFLMNSLGKYQNKELRSIDSADLDLPDKKEDAAPEAAEKAPPGFERVVELIKAALGDQVEDVRTSRRLVGSPCCLVSKEGAMSSQMEKLMRMANRDVEATKRIFELNPKSPLIARLAALSANRDHDDFIRDCGRQLFANALLLEGICPTPQDVTQRVEAFMSEAAEKRSPIIL